ncbi:zinc metallochaperone AztD [Leucobacter aridicollis]|uniref:zinc metallochaperone AztD n=1 Tax=Leucobacter aridicollis TaxID=283878 RepID=UPI0021080C67|nr:zinc metallochaperone AztD [Leucobacter aridicollis]UTX52177.1 hypothetical protein KI794_10435 [Leucobacter aridicollis]
MHTRAHTPAKGRAHTRRWVAAAAAGVSLVAVTACAPGTAAGEDHAGHDHGEDSSVAHTALAVTTPGGVTVLTSDAATGGGIEAVESFDTEEFTRLNAFGDGKHLLLTTSRGFEVLDADAAKLTGLVFPAEAAGHAVRHEGTTALYDDGTGITTLVPTNALLSNDTDRPDTRSFEADAPHHGVSIELGDGTLLTTVGTADGRSGATALEPHDDHWHDVTTSADCPGIHGEGTARNEVVVFGCEDGALLYKDDEFTKLDAPDAFGRMGNAFTAPDSPIVVGDYKSDPDAEGYLLGAVTLIDTEHETLDVVALPENVRYTFRGVTRGPEGNAYVLSTDGSIHVLDPKTGTIVASHPVITPWEGPANWQDAHPAIVADGDIAYVTEPATKSVHAIDLATGEKISSITLDAPPNEIAVALSH